MSDRLPRPIRLLLGATSFGIDERRLRDAVCGQVVLITGASSGVGEATALMLGRAGAIVLLVARRANLLEQLRDQIASAGGTAFAYPCDLADPDAIDVLAREVLEQHGHVDVVVSNAGLSIRRWISESYTRFDDVRRTIDAHHVVAVRGQDHRVSARTAAQIEHLSNHSLSIQLEDAFDQLALGQVILVLVQIVVCHGVVAAKDAVGHASASPTARHTCSIWDSSRPRPDGRYRPRRAMRSATG